MSRPGLSSLLDLDALMPAVTGTRRDTSGAAVASPGVLNSANGTPPAVCPDTSRAASVPVVPKCPGQNPIPNALPGHQKPSNGAGFGEGVPVVPVVPVKKRIPGGEPDENGRAAAGLQVEFRAGFPASPSAVLLMLGWFAERPGATFGDLAELLADLVKAPPGEQVRTWHERCKAAGLDPVAMLALPAPTEGATCDNCKHLDSYCRDLPGDGRRLFRWACGKGYRILEFGRGSERILISPPECESWERWYPGPWR